MTLLELLTAIRDESLSLPQLEKYRDDLIHVKTDMLKHVAELKKKRALFLIQEPEKSAVARKMAWNATEDGMKLEDRLAELRALPDEINALLSRIYSKIR